MSQPVFRTRRIYPLPPPLEVDANWRDQTIYLTLPLRSPTQPDSGRPEAPAEKTPAAKISPRKRIEKRRDTAATLPQSTVATKRYSEV